jgi:hypothetical protein
MVRMDGTMKIVYRDKVWKSKGSITLRDAL